jgi:hypothetical protein
MVYAKNRARAKLRYQESEIRVAGVQNRASLADLRTMIREESARAKLRLGGGQRVNPGSDGASPYQEEATIRMELRQTPTGRAASRNDHTKQGPPLLQPSAQLWVTHRDHVARARKVPWIRRML